MAPVEKPLDVSHVCSHLSPTFVRIMPKQAPRLSESEWIVANIVWEHPRSTASEIFRRIPEEVTWKPKTVNTFLARLAKKGVLGVERNARANVYYPKVDRSKCVQAESASFFHRVFRGAPAPMLAHFCETVDLDEEAIAKLRKILDEKSGGKKS